MTSGEFQEALAALGWKASDFCRMAGVSRNTPSRWLNDEVPIPLWVGKYIGMTMEVKRLYETYVIPRKSGS